MQVLAPGFCQPLMAILVSAMAIPVSAAPSYFNCQAAGMDELTGRIRLSVDLEAASIQITQQNAGGRALRIFEVGDQWVRGADGEYRIAIDRQTGFFIMGKIGDQPFAIQGQCRRAAERLF